MFTNLCFFFKWDTLPNHVKYMHRCISDHIPNHVKYINVFQARYNMKGETTLEQFETCILLNIFTFKIRLN